MKSFIFPFLALALGASVAIAAEDIYRSTMPDGSIRYGEAPDPAAKSFKKVAPPPVATGVSVITPEEKAKGAAPVREGGVAVMPQKERPSPRSAQQGELQAPEGLPKRAY
jgi:hypothetical protein